MIQQIHNSFTKGLKLLYVRRRLLFLFIITVIVILGTIYLYRKSFPLKECLGFLMYAFAILGVLVIIISIFQKELIIKFFLGKSYMKLFKVSELGAKNIGNLIIKYLPSNLSEEERKELKADLPIFLNWFLNFDSRSLLCR